MHIHDLRHVFALKMVMNGTSLYIAGELNAQVQERPCLTADEAATPSSCFQKAGARRQLLSPPRQPIMGC